MSHAPTPDPPRTRLHGLLGLAGIGTFLAALVMVHMGSPGIDMVRGYVSNLANEPLGIVFMAGTVVHGLGNLALAVGLARAVNPVPGRTAAVWLFALAAGGILAAAVFPVDPPGAPVTWSGQLHRAFASTAFVLELAALFTFAAAFREDPRWQRERPLTLALAVAAAAALTAFVISIQIGWAPGLTERLALAVFLAWEIRAALRLVALPA